MKTASILSCLLSLVAASPTPTTVENNAEPAHLVKRAGISEAATIGYASVNGGTTGGNGGTVTTVSTLPQFTAAVNEKNTAPVIVVVKGVITGSTNVRIGSNKSVLGLPGSRFDGVGLYIRRQKNVIVRNIISSNVLATNGDGIKIDESTNVWIDHCEFYSDLSHDKDYYDGLVDASHASDFITISSVYFHDHWKTSLIGHSDNNGAEDKGHLRITYANNYWKNLGSRAPSLRFGTAHVYNSFYQNMDTAINSRLGAQVLAQNNVFRNVTAPMESADADPVGYITSINNDLGGAPNTAPAGSLSASFPPYAYTLLSTSNVISTIPGQAGAKLTF